MKAGKTEATALLEMGRAREYEFDLPADSKRGAFDTEDAAPRGQLVDSTASGDSRTEMTVRAVAESHSRRNYDATSAAELDKQPALAARLEELDEFKQRDVYAEAPVAEASENTGKETIPVRWGDVNNGDDRSPENGSRLVVREVRRSQVDTVLAAMLPLEADEVLFPLAANGRAKSGDMKKLSFVEDEKA